jgi:uncharacterized membrane protein YczE
MPAASEVGESDVSRPRRTRRNLKVGIAVLAFGVGLYVTGWIYGLVGASRATSSSSYLAQQILLSLGGVLMVFGGLIAILSWWALRHNDSWADPEKLEYIP